MDTKIYESKCYFDEEANFEFHKQFIRDWKKKHTWKKNRFYW